MGKRGLLVFFLFVLILSVFVVGAAADPSKVLHFGFEENFDPNNHFEDSSNYNNDGTCFGMACPKSMITNPANVKIGNSAVRFNHVEKDFIKVFNSPSFQQLHNAFSISLWMKTNNRDALLKTLVSREDREFTGHDRNFVLQLNKDGKPILRFSSLTGINDCNVLGVTGELRDNRWHHIVAFFDGSAHTCGIYVDGNLVGVDNTVESPQGFGEDLFIGARRVLKDGKVVSLAPYEGVMDDLQIFNRRISEREIISIFRQEEVYTCCEGGFQDGCSFATIDSCRADGGAVMECVPDETTSEGPPGELKNYTQTNTTNPALGSWVANLTRDVTSTGVNNTQYVNGTFDCDDFANALERNLTALGYNATYTVYWCTRPDGSRPGHCVTDVHSTDGTLVFIEPQTGRIVNLDFDGDGRVEARNHHPAGRVNTDDNCAIEVYEDSAAAAAAGAPRD